MAGLWGVPEVRGIHGEEEGRENCPLQDYSLKSLHDMRGQPLWSVVIENTGASISSVQNRDEAKNFLHLRNPPPMQALAEDMLKYTSSIEALSWLHPSFLGWSLSGFLLNWSA